MHTGPLIWACGIVTLLPDIPASGCQQGLQLEGQCWWQGGGGKEMRRVDRGQNHKFGVSHGQTGKIYDRSSSSSAAWCCGFRMTGMGVRSDSGFSLYTLSGNCSQCDWLKMAVFRVVSMSNATVFPCARFNIVLSVYTWIWTCRCDKIIKSTCRDWHKLRQIRLKINKTNFQEKFLEKKILLQTCKTEISSYLIILCLSLSTLRSYDLLTGDIMETTAIFIGW